MNKFLEFGAAFFAFLAAIFWFLSVYGKTPPMLSYWDAVPESDPFYKAIKFSVRMNKWAAFFSGVSAVLGGANLLF